MCVGGGAAGGGRGGRERGMKIFKVPETMS